RRPRRRRAPRRLRPRPLPPAPRPRRPRPPPPRRGAPGPVQRGHARQPRHVLGRRGRRRAGGRRPRRRAPAQRLHRRRALRPPRDQHGRARGLLHPRQHPPRRRDDAATPAPLDLTLLIQGPQVTRGERGLLDDLFEDVYLDPAEMEEATRSGTLGAPPRMATTTEVVLHVEE